VFLQNKENGNNLKRSKAFCAASLSLSVCVSLSHTHTHTHTHVMSLNMEMFISEQGVEMH